MIKPTTIEYTSEDILWLDFKGKEIRIEHNSDTKNILITVHNPDEDYHARLLVEEGETYPWPDRRWMMKYKVFINYEETLTLEVEAVDGTQAIYQAEELLNASAGVTVGQTPTETLHREYVVTSVSSKTT